MRWLDFHFVVCTTKLTFHLSIINKKLNLNLFQISLYLNNIFIISHNTIPEYFVYYFYNILILFRYKIELRYICGKNYFMNESKIIVLKNI